LKAPHTRVYLKVPPHPKLVPAVHPQDGIV
jgi:hypothetical protein